VAEKLIFAVQKAMKRDFNSTLSNLNDRRSTFKAENRL
jgi:hypothetical protein